MVERTVARLPVAIEFYREALGFELARKPGPADPAWVEVLDAEQLQSAELRLGEQTIRLTEAIPAGQPYPAGSTAADLWFQHIAIVTAGMPAAYARLQKHRPVSITSGGPQLLPPTTGSVTAYKFRDPDGQPLELLQFPPWTGVARWQAATTQPTMGIDHSAISVADADASIAFYCDLLGFTLAARQTNQGPAQEKLDGLPGAVVEVVALNPREATPHLELLAYRTPRGRANPAPLQGADIAADRLVLEVDDLTAILHRLPGSPPRLHQLQNGDKAALLPDPNGHLLVLIECATGTGL
jgi:catechol 2,3-dioxygenase-like lactoylglutathione lyase family enzyme